MNQHIPCSPHTSRFGGKQEHFDVWIVREFIYETLTLVDLGTAIKSDVPEAQV
jgi:hypothetical protein